MKRKFILASAALLASCCISLQAKDKTPQYVPNSFSDNWSVFVAGGLNSAVIDIKSGKFNHSERPSINIGVGKWFNPFFGSRFSYTGYGRQLTDNSLGLDLMWNWSNQFGKYKTGRLYEAVPYFRAAFNFGNSGRKFAEGLGYLSVFNISEHWAATIDLNGIFVHGESFKGTDLYAGAYVGIVWKIGKSSWTPGSEVVPVADYNIAKSALEAANRSIENLSSENKILKENEKYLTAEILRLKNVSKEAELAGNYDQTLSTEFENYVPLCHFAIGKTRLSEVELEKVAFYASLISKSKGVKFAIVGSADPGTGSSKMNKKLRTDRAIYVYNLLTRLGVSVDKINIVSDPKCDTRSKNPELCRAVLIKTIK